MSQALGFHEYANLFPLIEGDEFFEFAGDIRDNGLAYRIDLLGPEILDGRNRYRALVWIVSTGERLGAGWGTRAGYPLDPAILINLEAEIYRPFNLKTDGDPLKYVLSKNMQRRHMDESQRGMVAAGIANLGRGRPAAKNPANLPVSSIEAIAPAPVSQVAAAAMMSVSDRTVRDAVAVRRDAAPEIVEAVTQGRLAVSAAVEIATQPKARQAEILALLPRDADGKLDPDVKKALGPVIKEIRAEKVQAKKDKRAEREQQSGRQLQMLEEKKYGVAIEDFEWHHAAWSMVTGADRHPSMHYETAEDAQTPEEIVARCAERFKCLADDCILFKWVTGPHLAIAIKTLELQGFRYVTNLIWNKERAGDARGPGYWFTGEHEQILVCVRGKVVPPAYAHFRSTFAAPVGEHSAKPRNLHDIIDFHWPNTPKVEFNARSGREGWESWGYDAPPAIEALAPAPLLDEWLQFCAFIDLDRPQMAILAPGFEKLGYVFRISADRPDWSLTDLGWRRVEELRAERERAAEPMNEIAASEQPIAAASPPASPDALRHDGDRIVDQPEQASLGAGEAVPPAERPGANSRAQRALAHDNDGAARAILDVLLAVDGSHAIEGAVAEAQRGLGLIVGKAKPKLTKAGRARLDELVEHFNWMAKLDQLPTSLQQLVGMYGVALYNFDKCVARNDREGADQAAEQLELLQERANGNTNFGMACDDSPAERLRVENAAPIGVVPGWRQRGVFRLVIEGTAHLVTHGDEGAFCVYAEDPNRPFISETGFRSFAGDMIAFWATVEKQAEALIRECIGAEDDSSGKPKPRKKPLPMPSAVYRMPAHDSADRESYLIAGSKEKKPRKKAAEPEPEAAQCRLPLDDEEIERQRALCSIGLGESIDSQVARDLIGRGYAEAQDDGLRVTAEGVAWLGQLVDLPTPLDIPVFIEARP